MPKKLTATETAVKELRERVEKLESDKKALEKTFGSIATIIPTSLARLWKKRSIEDAIAVEEMIAEHSTPLPDPPVRWPLWVAVLLLACYCAALGLTVWGPRVAGISPKPAVTVRELPPEPAPFPASVLHTVVVRAPKDCWLGLGDDDAGALTQHAEGNFQWGQLIQGQTISVRDGCPGKVTFSVDGVEVHPVNRAINKAKVELVTLP
jgi:hypothetical protein